MELAPLCETSGLSPDKGRENGSMSQQEWWVTRSFLEFAINNGGPIDFCDKNLLRDGEFPVGGVCLPDK